MCIITLHSSYTKVLTIIKLKFLAGVVLLLCVINPRCACAARVMVVAMSVCLSVCVCVCVCPLSHISPLGRLFVVKMLPRTQWATKVKKFFGIFSKTALLPRSSTPSLERPYIRLAISPVDNMHAHCAYERHSVMQHGLHDAVSSLCILYSFTMIILGLEILVRVVYLAGYQPALSISETVVLLYSSLSRIESLLNTRVVY